MGSGMRGRRCLGAGVFALVFGWGCCAGSVAWVGLLGMVGVRWMGFGLFAGLVALG